MRGGGPGGEEENYVVGEGAGRRRAGVTEMEGEAWGGDASLLAVYGNSL